MEKTRIVRQRKENNYSIMSNCPLKNKNISLKATGLMAYLLSLPENWEVIISEVEKHKTDGRESFRSAFKECIEIGYIEKRTDRVAGRFFVTYIIYESLQLRNLKRNEKEESLFNEHSSLTDNGFSDTVKPTRLNRRGGTDTVNPKLLITNELITEKEITKKQIKEKEEISFLNLKDKFSEYLKSKGIEYNYGSNKEYFAIQKFQDTKNTPQSVLDLVDKLIEVKKHYSKDTFYLGICFNLSDLSSYQAKIVNAYTLIKGKQQAESKYSNAQKYGFR